MRIIDEAKKLVQIRAFDLYPNGSFFFDNAWVCL